VNRPQAEQKGCVFLRERLKRNPSETMAKYVNLPRMRADNERSFENMARVNLAHVLMLQKQKIIDRDVAKNLAEAIEKLLEKGPGAIELDPNYEDYYFNTERCLIALTGIETGGKLHTARSRNDLHSTILRMNVRDAYLKLLPRFLDLRAILLEAADRHRETVMTGYTHMQPAQPMTMGFYLAGVAEAFERDFDRLSAAWGHLNYSTLGACAFAGTGFDIDRQYTAELLGFYGPIVNTIDAVGTRDYILEIFSAFAILASTVNRLAHDLYYWTTDEFAYVELDDSLCGTSSIMPQKKNPAVLEYIKSKSSHQLAAFADAFCCMRGIPLGHNRDLGGESVHLLWDAFNEMEATFELLKEVVRTLIVREEHLKERADKNYCTVTDLADELVKSEGISFRSAHQVVGHVVMECVDQHLTAQDITAEKLDEAFVRFTGHPLGWDSRRVKKVLDSFNVIQNRKSQGSPNPKECSLMVDAMSARLTEDRACLNRFAAELTSAYERLDQEVSKLLAS
jgi:argininosuccinate lyase